LRDGIAKTVVADAPCKATYFRREVNKRLGLTTAQYQGFKPMEIAMQLQEAGHSVSETALPPGFAASYYFSRLVKRHIGTSPWDWQK